MKTLQKPLFIFAIAAALCILIVAVVSAAAEAPNGPIIISKTVSPQVIAPNYTGVLTYTITVTNTAAPAIQSAFMEDTLPTLLSFEAWVDTPDFGTITQVGDTIMWTGALPAPPTVPTPAKPNILVFVFTVRMPGPESMATLLRDGMIVNNAYAGRMDGTVHIVEDSDRATTHIRHYIFLPLVIRNLAQ